MNLLFVLLKNSYKKYLTWTFLWALMGLFIAWMFEPFRQQVETEEFFGAFNSDLLEAFNISDQYFASVENLTGGEFVTFLTLLGGIFALLAGIAIVAGRTEDRQIAFYLTTPISRIQYLVTQIFIELILLVISSFVIIFLTYVSFIVITEQDEISETFFILAATGISLVLSFFLLAGVLMGLVLEQARARSLGIGLVIILWFLDTFSELDQYPDIAKPLSPFHYFDVDELTASFELSNIAVMLPVTTLLMLGIAVFLFRRKSIYL